MCLSVLMMPPLQWHKSGQWRLTLSGLALYFYESSLSGHHSSVSIVTRIRFPQSFSDRGKEISHIHSDHTVNGANAQEGYISGIKQQGREDAKSPPVITRGVILSRSDMVSLSGASWSTNLEISKATDCQISTAMKIHASILWYNIV